MKPTTNRTGCRLQEKTIHILESRRKKWNTLICCDKGQVGSKDTQRDNKRNYAEKFEDVAEKHPIINYWPYTRNQHQLPTPPNMTYEKGMADEDSFGREVIRLFVKFMYASCITDTDF